MSGTGRRQPPLKADRRYPAQGAKSGGAKSGGGKSAGGGRKRQTARRAARGGNMVTRFFGRLLRRAVQFVWGIGWRVTLMLAFVLGMATLYYYSTLPAAKDLLDARTRGSVTLFDDNGAPFAWRGETFGGTVTAETVSPNLRNAIVATEDRRFYHHFGVSPRGILGAMLINLRAGRRPFDGNGGSTITQQVAKLLCLGIPYDQKVWQSEADYEGDCRRSTVWRKLKEVPYALAMEAKYSKNEILTIYLNRAYLGAGTRGFEAAAERYFDKHASDVTPAEGAMLAGLLKAPSYYAPTNNLARAQDRANVIIDLMAEQSYITLAQAQDAHTNPAMLSKAAAQQAGGYFADWVMDSGASFLTSDTTEDVIIKTTLDPRIQAGAESAMKDVFENKLKDGSNVQAAIVVMSPDGAVRGMVGGRTSQVSGAFNRATQALRQTGSAFKPFVYAAALDMGMSPNDTVEDAPLTINVKGSGPWSPKDYERDYKGTVTLTTALKLSLNIPAVKISEQVGRANVRKVAADFGIQSDLAAGPALALGVSEVTLLDMTGAYAGILNGGSSVKPYGLIELRLKGDKQPLVGQGGGIGERVISPKADAELIYMMTQVIESGTGVRAKLPDRQAAGKTGTTQEARDAWFIGFTADYVVGVWLGNDDNSPLTGTTGGGQPADIWRATMVNINKGVPPKPLPMIVPDVPTPGTPAEQVGASPQPDSGTLADRIIMGVLNTLTGNN